MARFEDCIDGVLSHEGGYVNDPDDPGGETKFGISKRAYPNLDIKNLTLEEAKKIYKRDYWDRLRLDEVKHQEIACAVFDAAVNLGHRTAISLLQQALYNFYPDIIIDGIIGPQTLGYLNSCDFPDVVLKLFSYYRIRRYLTLAEKNPELRKYLKGWIRRA